MRLVPTIIMMMSNRNTIAAKELRKRLSGTYAERLLNGLAGVSGIKGKSSLVWRLYLLLGLLATGGYVFLSSPAAHNILMGRSWERCVL
jgi:hypothetical protein